MMTLGHPYHFVVGGDFLNYFWCFLLCAKSHAFATIQKFFADVQTQFRTSSHTLQTDSDKEFVNHASTSFFDRAHQHSDVPLVPIHLTTKW
jgi:hypothetical protein